MILRSARHTSNLSALQHFYTEVLELEVLGAFNDHDRYDGLFLGHENADWHLEFTSDGSAITHTFNDDDILVFYPRNATEYAAILNNIERLQVPVYTPRNPYWKANGILIKDPDGYNIIVSNLKVTS